MLNANAEKGFADSTDSAIFDLIRRGSDVIGLASMLHDHDAVCAARLSDGPMGLACSA